MPEKSVKVLLVEDNPGDARLIREQLRGAGNDRVDMTNVERLEQGIRCLSENAFNVVLLDLSLPDSHGLETLSRLLEAQPGVPIVVLTGTSDEDLGTKAVRTGAQDYLVKGRADGETIKRAINYAVERQRWLKAEGALRRSQTGHLWETLIKYLGRGARVILYNAGVEAGASTFNFIQEAWSPAGETDFTRALQEYFLYAGLFKLREFKMDQKARTVRVRLEHSFEAAHYEHGSKEPVCHFLRGLFCGIGGKLLGVPSLMCNEVSCEANGGKLCQFVVHPKPH